MNIDCYWSRSARTWICMVLDTEGNQLWDAEYYPNRRVMTMAWWPHSCR